MAAPPPPSPLSECRSHSSSGRSRPASGKLSKDKGKGSRRSNATSNSDSDSDEDANDSDYEGGAGAPAAGAAGVGGVSLRLSSKGGTTATTAGASQPKQSASHSDHPLSSSLLDGSRSRPLGGSHRSGGGGSRPLPSSAFALELARLSDGTGSGGRREGASGPPLDEDADMFFPVDDAELLEELMMGGDGDHGAAPFDAAMPGGDGYETLEQEVGGVEAVHFCLFAAPRHA